MLESPCYIASEIERRSTYLRETGDERWGRPTESRLLEGTILALAIAAGICAGIWLGSLWLGAAAGVVVLSGFGCAQTSLARRFGWRRFSFYRVLSGVWDFVLSIDFILCLLRMIFR